MSYEAFGDGDDGQDYGHLIDAGWWDCDQVEAVIDAIKALHATTIYDGGKKENGINVEFLARMTLLKEAAGILASDDKWVVDARAALAAAKAGAS